MNEWWALTLDVQGTRRVVRARTDERLIIGRSRTAQIVIPMSTVGRQHASLDVDAEGRVFLEDLGSSNGVWVGGVKIQREVIAPGTEMMAGRGVVRFIAVEPADPPTTWVLGLEFVRDGEDVKARFELGTDGSIHVGAPGSEVVLPTEQRFRLKIHEGRIVVSVDDDTYVHDLDHALIVGETEVWLTVTPAVPKRERAVEPRTRANEATWRIRVECGESKYAFDVETNERVFVGSAEECSLVLNDLEVAPCHATLLVDHKGRLIVEEQARDPAIRRTHHEEACVTVGPYPLSVGISRLG